MLVASLLLAALGLAGCTSGADDPLRYPSSTSATAGPATNSTDNSTAAPAGGNTTAGGPAPSANLTATPTNGTAPLNVTFNLTGSTSGGSLAWTLDVDGDNVTDANGTVLPSSFNHTYSGNGTFNATLTVSNGVQNATAVAQVVVAGNGTMQTSAVVQTLSCDVAQGLPVAARAGGNGGNPGVGGCLTQALDQDSVLVAIGYPDACFSDPEAAVGDEFAEGDSFNIYCDESVSDTTVTMDFGAA